MVTGYPQAGERFGRYDIVRRIGRGGMGVVYAAVHRDLQRDVALKLLSPDLSDTQEYRNRFVREAQTLARLDSPHIVRVYDAGEQDGWLFIATELVPDGDLGDLLRAEGGQPVDRALDLFTQIAEGLADAHAAGILHRDIKPSNVLIKRSAGGSVRAILCDLGISAVLDAEHTKTVGVIGTLAYMAPELHEGAEASVATDIYALGCLLWALLTGGPPYTGTDFRVARAHLHDPIPQVPGDAEELGLLTSVLSTLMAKSAAERPASLTEVRASLALLSNAAATIESPLSVPSDQATELRRIEPLADEAATQRPERVLPPPAHNVGAAVTEPHDHARRGPARAVRLGIAVLSVAAVAVVGAVVSSGRSSHDVATSGSATPMPMPTPTVIAHSHGPGQVFRQFDRSTCDPFGGPDESFQAVRGWECDWLGVGGGRSTFVIEYETPEACLHAITQDDVKDVAEVGNLSPWVRNGARLGVRAVLPWSVSKSGVQLEAGACPTGSAYGVFVLNAETYNEENEQAATTTLDGLDGVQLRDPQS